MTELSFWTRFVLAALATWRVTHLLAREDGPADLIVRLRTRLGTGFLSGLLDCFYCVSVWVALPMALLVSRTPMDLLLTWLALSGSACLLQRLGQEQVVFHALPETSGEPNDGMLRTEANGSTDPNVRDLAETGPERSNGEFTPFEAGPSARHNIQGG